jgi:hypothetical protein
MFWIRNTVDKWPTIRQLMEKPLVRHMINELGRAQPYIQCFVSFLLYFSPVSLSDIWVFPFPGSYPKFPWWIGSRSDRLPRKIWILKINFLKLFKNTVRPQIAWNYHPSTNPVVHQEDLMSVWTSYCTTGTSGSGAVSKWKVFLAGYTLIEEFSYLRRWGALNPMISWSTALMQFLLTCMFGIPPTHLILLFDHLHRYVVPTVTLAL